MLVRLRTDRIARKDCRRKLPVRRPGQQHTRDGTQKTKTTAILLLLSGTSGFSKMDDVKEKTLKRGRGSKDVRICPRKSSILLNPGVPHEIGQIKAWCYRV